MSEFEGMPRFVFVLKMAVSGLVMCPNLERVSHNLRKTTKIEIDKT